MYLHPKNMKKERKNHWLKLQFHILLQLKSIINALCKKLLFIVLGIYNFVWDAVRINIFYGRASKILHFLSASWRFTIQKISNTNKLDTYELNLTLNLVEAFYLGQNFFFQNSCFIIKRQKLAKLRLHTYMQCSVLENSSYITLQTSNTL